MLEIKREDDTEVFLADNMQSANISPKNSSNQPSQESTPSPSLTPSRYCNAPRDLDILPSRVIAP